MLMKVAWDGASPTPVREAVAAEGRDGLTALGRAALLLKPERVEALLARGADANAKSTFAGGCTPTVLALAGYCEARDGGCGSEVAVACVKVLGLLFVGGALVALPRAVLIPVLYLTELVREARHGKPGLETALERLHPSAS